MKTFLECLQLRLLSVEGKEPGSASEARTERQGETLGAGGGAASERTESRGAGSHGELAWSTNRPPTPPALQSVLDPPSTAQP
ncbi:hypothetical protein NDU88_003767 [Pleurodeles waltl]|uniref:Uncharacterized protein n=1 Tax=Pleurodeles waltl TaxID=8319 RepID=A0AAV7RJH8_PLEWA|nr:hypothetical protein NDU88_003767 [Pleurodeles waltl]